MCGITIRMSYTAVILMDYFDLIYINLTRVQKNSIIYLISLTKYKTWIQPSYF